MGVQLYVNNAEATLNGTLAIGGTLLNLASGQGSRFPSPSGGDYFLITLYEKDAGGDEINYEIVYCTARTADALTITRDFEGIVVAAGGTSGGWGYPAAVGINPSQVVYVEMRETAYLFENLLPKDGNLAGLASNATARSNIGAEASANKDASGGYAGLTLFKINMRNVADTFTSFQTNTNTAARTYTWPDKDLTVAGLVDFATPPAYGNVTPAAVWATTVGATGNISTLAGAKFVANGVAATLFNAYSVAGSTTAAAYGDYANTGVTFRVGVESSAGGALATGSSAYAALIGTTGAVPLQFSTNGTVRATLDALGNYGVGVVPAVWHTSRKAFQFGTQSAMNTTGNNTQFTTNYYANSSDVATYIGTGFALRYNQDGTGAHVMQCAPSGTAGNPITFTQVFQVSAGNSLALEGSTQKVGTGITFPSTQVPSSDANTFDDYRELTYTATATGLTTSPTGTARVVKAGNEVAIEIPAITGTSNATTFTLTGMPSACRPAATRSVLCRVQDNGGTVTVGLAEIDSSGVITLFKDAAGSAFTNAGTKSTSTVNVSYVI